MNWEQAKKAMDFQLDMSREGCLAKLELLKKMQDQLNNERGTQEILLAQAEKSQGELMALRDEQSFRAHCDARAQWDEFYSIGATSVDTTPTAG